MHITIQRDVLFQALTETKPYVSNKWSLPILANCKLSTQEGCVEITTTNLEGSLSVWVPATILSAGATTVSHKRLLELVKTAPKKSTITLQMQEDGLLADTGHTSMTMGTMDVGEFPAVPIKIEHTGDVSVNDQGTKTTIEKVDRIAFVMDTSEISRVTKLTAFAASKDESRPKLTSICMVLDPENDDLRGVHSRAIGLR